MILFTYHHSLELHSRMVLCTMLLLNGKQPLPGTLSLRTPFISTCWVGIQNAIGFESSLNQTSVMPQSRSSISLNSHSLLLVSTTVYIEDTTFARIPLFLTGVMILIQVIMEHILDQFHLALPLQSLYHCPRLDVSTATRHAPHLANLYILTTLSIE